MAYKDLEKRQATRRAYRAKTRDQRNAARRQLYAENPPTVEERAKKAVYDRTYKATRKAERAAHKNPDDATREPRASLRRERTQKTDDATRKLKEIAYHKEYRATHKAERNAYNRTYYALYPEKRTALKVTIKKWNAANPEKKRASSSRRRARKAGVAINDLSAGQIREIKQAYGFRCSYCNAKLPARQLTVDHITPIIANGDNTLHNVTVACRTCNRKKGTGPPPKAVQPLLLTLAPTKKAKEKK